VATAEPNAGSPCDEAIAPAAACTPSRLPDPLPPQPSQVAAEGAGQALDGIQQLGETSSPPHQLAFGFGQSAEVANPDPNNAQLPGGPRRPVKRRKSKLLEQERLPFPKAPSGLAGGE
jgi:hypothetical protein